MDEVFAGTGAEKDEGISKEVISGAYTVPEVRKLIALSAKSTPFSISQENNYRIGGSRVSTSPLVPTNPSERSSPAASFVLLYDISF